MSERFHTEITNADRKYFAETIEFAQKKYSAKLSAVLPQRSIKGTSEIITNYNIGEAYTQRDDGGLFRNPLTLREVAGGEAGFNALKTSYENRAAKCTDIIYNQRQIKLHRTYNRLDIPRGNDLSVAIADTAKNLLESVIRARDIKTVIAMTEDVNTNITTHQAKFNITQKVVPVCTQLYGMLGLVKYNMGDYGANVTWEISQAQIASNIMANIVRGKLTRDKILEARNRLLANNIAPVNENEIYLLCSEAQKSELLKNVKLISSDFVDNNNQKRGTIEEVLGCKIITSDFLPFVRASHGKDAFAHLQGLGVDVLCAAQDDNPADDAARLNNEFKQAFSDLSAIWPDDGGDAAAKTERAESIKRFMLSSCLNNFVVRDVYLFTKNALQYVTQANSFFKHLGVHTSERHCSYDAYVTEMSHAIRILESNVVVIKCLEKDPGDFLQQNYYSVNELATIPTTQDANKLAAVPALLTPQGYANAALNRDLPPTDPNSAMQVVFATANTLNATEAEVEALAQMTL